jgi:hypothetical protein
VEKLSQKFGMNKGIKSFETDWKMVNPIVGVNLAISITENGFRNEKNRC